MKSSLVAPIVAPFPDTWDWSALGVVRKTLSNGLRVILAENHTVPLAFLSWTAQAGFESDPAGLEGLASLTPLLLREGTAHRSGRRITRELDDMGAYLLAGADWDSAFINMGLLSCDLAQGAELLLDLARAATFPDAAVARVRQRRLTELERRRRDPRTLANEEFARALFGASVYGRSPLGTPATVSRIDAAHVAAFHNLHYRPANSYVVVAGKFDSAMATDLLESFELPPSRPVSPLPVLSFVPAGEACAGVRLVNVPRAKQTEIRVGHAGVARDSEHLPGLEVLSAILGGGPASRLARSVRQAAGLTYHIRSRFMARRRGGTFVVETSVPSEATGTALAAIRREIERLRDELVPAADVEQTKRALFGAELRRFEELIGTGAALGPEALHGDPVHHLERRRQAIAAVEQQGLRELARRYLNPERLVEVVVGPADTLNTILERGTRCRHVPLESTS